MVHILRWNIREKFKLLSDLKDFEPWFPMIPKLCFFGRVSFSWLKLVSIHEQLWVFQVISKKLLYIIEGSLNSKLPTIWRVEKQMKSRWAEVKSKERRCNSAKVRRKKIHPRQIWEEVAKCFVFSIRVSGESKSRLVKAAGAESCGQRRNQKLHAAVASF